jgi:mRNA interferase MazF
VQGDLLNQSRIGTVVCVLLTTDLRWANAPGNLLLASRLTGLPKDSIANVTQLVTLDKSELAERAGKLPRAKLELLLAGLDVMLGRSQTAHVSAVSVGPRRHVETASAALDRAELLEKLRPTNAPDARTD